MHIFNGLHPSGMERMLHSGGKYSQVPLDRVTIVGQGTENPFASELEGVGYSVATIPKLKSWKGMAALMRTIRSERPSVIHVHTESAYAQAVLAAKAASPGTPIIRSVHSIFKKRFLPNLYRRITSVFLDRYVARFVACSPEVQSFESAFGRNIEVVWNWVDDSFFVQRGIEDRDLTASSTKEFIFVGNCSVIKNHDLVLRALQVSHVEARVPFRLYHYGRESGASVFEVETLNRLEKGGRLGHRGVGNPLESMSQRPLYLMPSLHEGMGVALAEAIVVGLSCLVADSVGLQWAREFPNVRHVSNDLEAWTDALISTPSRMKVDESVNIERFSAELGMGRYHSIYKAAVADAKTTRGRFKHLPVKHRVQP
ncbi:hypothetical protein J2T10_000267 [Paenarthrobacter nicotinovorans]|uniref:D-inositol 3-phosphate glycosyltransferase n=1 Tax=Paenarthrobacter nicotinovorans TaxID=29320 RepID=A0ABT9TI80_PAENI|nr:glycosyltransferase [Paenarthrobacter nicotinovorans]MDQ0100648.1 hypothetical protein [Paenarthrobacter nicotinovorans]